eukprot:XP_001689797.1 predicted protein [Chlamydomonas reinhardtii]
MADTKFISSLAIEFNLDIAWELRAVTAFAKAVPELRTHIRGHAHKSKQVDFLNEPMQETKLYNNVTVFVPGYETPYAKLDYQYLTRNPFVKQMERERYFRVVTVEVMLGWKEGRISKDEYKAAEWATVHIAGDKGASRWCFKKISGLVDADKLKIEIDGMAFSLERVVLVERKPRIKLMYGPQCVCPYDPRRKLVAAGAPNTDMLRDRFRPEIKPLEVFLMADGWVDDPGEAAACAVRMEEEGIAPLLPTGDGGYDARDSCGRWPVDDGTRRRGQTFLANNKPGRLRPKRSGSSAATDASGSSGASRLVVGEKGSSTQPSAMRKTSRGLISGLKRSRSMSVLGAPAATSFLRGSYGHTHCGPGGASAQQWSGLQIEEETNHVPQQV